jgi:hypothetical protein
MSERLPMNDSERLCAAVGVAVGALRRVIEGADPIITPDGFESELFEAPTSGFLYLSGASGGILYRRVGELPSLHDVCLPTDESAILDEVCLPDSTPAPARLIIDLFDKIEARQRAEEAERLRQHSNIAQDVCEVRYFGGASSRLPRVVALCSGIVVVRPEGEDDKESSVPIQPASLEQVLEDLASLARSAN